MIFYFSGTGNSQHAAKLLANTLEDEVISINQCLKEGKEKTFYSDRPLLFVVPTYAWRIPKVVSQWISSTHFEGNRNAYFILTCGGSVGNAITYAKKLCEEAKLKFYGLELVAMPNNYVALSNTPDKEECVVIMKEAEKRLDILALEIKQGNPFSDVSLSFKDRMNSGPINGLFYSLFVHDKGFNTTQACISCGKCAQRCPLNNIKMTNGKPEWNGNCTHCMACIGGCPVEAIEYKSSSKGNRRYFIMEE